MEKNIFCVVQKGSSAVIDGWQKMEMIQYEKEKWAGKSGDLDSILSLSRWEQSFFNFSGLQLSHL